MALLAGRHTLPILYLILPPAWALKPLLSHFFSGLWKCSCFQHLEHSVVVIPSPLWRWNVSFNIPFDFDSVSNSGSILHMHAHLSVHVAIIDTVSKEVWIGNGLMYGNLSTFRLTIYSQEYYTCQCTLRGQSGFFYQSTKQTLRFYLVSPSSWNPWTRSPFCLSFFQI